MLELRPFEARDAESVVTWFADEMAFHKWCANRFDHFPITPTELAEHYAQNGAPDLLYPMTAFDEDGVAGQLFMRFLDEEKADEIALHLNTRIREKLGGPDNVQ